MNELLDRNAHVRAGVSYRDKASFRIEKEVPQNYLLRYEEDLEHGQMAPRDRPFFTTEEGLDACEKINGWNPTIMKNYNTGAQTFGRHVFEVRCKGQSQMDMWLEKTPVVNFGPGRRFIGGVAGALDVSKQAYFKITLSNLPSAIGDDVVFGKLRQYGMPDESRKSEMDAIKYGKWRGYQTGNRVFYMKTIHGELGMPVGFRLKGMWIRCFHYGQVRGVEREEAESKIRAKVMEANMRRGNEENQRGGTSGQEVNIYIDQELVEESNQRQRDVGQNNSVVNGPNADVTYKIVKGKAVPDDEPFYAGPDIAQNIEELHALQSEIEEMQEAREREERQRESRDEESNERENKKEDGTGKSRESSRRKTGKVKSRSKRKVNVSNRTLDQFFSKEMKGESGNTEHSSCEKVEEEDSSEEENQEDCGYWENGGSPTKLRPQRKRARDALSPPTPTQIQDFKKSNINIHDHSSETIEDESCKESDGQYESSREMATVDGRSGTESVNPEDKNNGTQLENTRDPDKHKVSDVEKENDDAEEKDGERFEHDT